MVGHLVMVLGPNIRILLLRRDWSEFRGEKVERTNKRNAEKKSRKTTKAMIYNFFLLLTMTIIMGAVHADTGTCTGRKYRESGFRVGHWIQVYPTVIIIQQFLLVEASGQAYSNRVPQGRGMCSLFLKRIFTNDFILFKYKGLNKLSHNRSQFD